MHRIPFPRRLTASLPVLLLAAALTACGGGDDDREPTPSALALTKIGGHAHAGGASSAEITAYDPGTRRLFVVNGALGSIDVLDLADPTAPRLLRSIASTELWDGAGGVNSVAVSGGRIALAVEARVKTDPGRLVLIGAADGALLASAEVGALPDMVAFTPDGRSVLVANEGEPDSYGQPGSVDPEGSVAIVDVAAVTPSSRGLALTARIADFRAYEGRRDELLAAGVRIYGPGASVAQDLEPEYVAVSPDGAKAYVTLQENNAIAVVDIASARVESIRALGYKDHALPGAGFDASDRDDAVAIRQWPVKSLYLPDAIASYSVGGRTYLVTANEGDAREYAGIPGGREDPRLASWCAAGLDPAVFPDALLLADDQLGRLRVTMYPGGDRDGRNARGQCDEIVAFGSRSFSIWNADGGRVWDSGDDLEQLTRALPNASFNASNDSDELDDRSAAKGPEPEGVVVASFGRRTYAFVGLERVGGIVVYDVSEPAQPAFATYLNTRAGVDGDRGPEGLAFIAAKDSPNGKPLLVVGHETSGTTAIYQVDLSY